MEEEDHQEDVSFQDNFIHLKNIMFTVVFFSAAYQVHKAILRKQEERKARFEGRAPVVDINAPEYQKNLSEEQIAYLEPGGDWEFYDVRGKKFTSENLQGNYYLMFFGNTLSPDVTPLTLLKMTKAISMILRNKES